MTYNEAKQKHSSKAQIEIEKWEQETLNKANNKKISQDQYYARLSAIADYVYNRISLKQMWSRFN